MSDNNTDSSVLIGQIAKARGLHGEVNVYPLTDKPERFKFLKNATLVSESGSLLTYEIDYVRLSEPFILLKLNGINDRNAAESLRGMYLSVDKDDTYQLDDDSYFVYDLLGLFVYTIDNKKLGRIKKVIQYPVNDILVIQTESEELMLPATKEFVPEVDIKNKRVVVVLPDGLPTYPKGTV